MRFTSLDDWLDWQEQLHPISIELGLDRIRQVWGRMGEHKFDCPVITVAGTNGKGSSVAMLQAIYLAAGYSVASYTSPHLFKYNERVCLDGKPVDDAQLCDAFAVVDEARGDISLTYFEFGTLAALHIFAQVQPEVVLLEVGLGGRLDAVNIIDADVALITSIDLDHQAWLGDTRDAIALEKAGILRTGRDAVINDPHPPASLTGLISDGGIPALFLNRDYAFSRENGHWRWQAGSITRTGLPIPSLSGSHQLENTAGVLMVVHLLHHRVPVSQIQLRHGLLSVVLPGRFHIMAGDSGSATLIFDVAHNPDAARALASTLVEYPCKGTRRAVFSILDDKDVLGVLEPFQGLIDEWYLAPLGVSRASTSTKMAAALTTLDTGAVIDAAASIPEALLLAREKSGADDVILVFGSFYTVAQACG